MARRSDGEGTAPKQRKDGIWYRAIRIEGTGKRKYLYAKSKAELSAPVIKCKKTPNKKCRFLAERRNK